MDIVLLKLLLTEILAYCMFCLLFYSYFRASPFVSNYVLEMSRVLRKPALCICENKDADQLSGNREADQRLCFRYTDSTIPLLSKSEISSLLPYSVIAQPSLCQTWSETPKTGFLRTRLKYSKGILGHGGMRSAKRKCVLFPLKVYTFNLKQDLWTIFKT